jgi:hypothetical protein
VHLLPSAASPGLEAWMCAATSHCLEATASQCLEATASRRLDAAMPPPPVTLRPPPPRLCAASCGLRLGCAPLPPIALRPPPPRLCATSCGRHLGSAVEKKEVEAVGKRRVSERGGGSGQKREREGQPVGLGYIMSLIHSLGHCWASTFFSSKFVLYF